jgi:hypothetical protein
MGDSSETKTEAFARRLLEEDSYVYLDEDSIPWILNHTDFFDSQCRVVTTLSEVILSPYAFIEGKDDEVWHKVGQAVGNLQRLKFLRISIRDRDGGSYILGEVPPILAWGERELACILSRVQQKVALALDYESDMWTVGEVQALARAIHGFPRFTRFDSSSNLPYESMDTLYSALATLPALESLYLSAAPPRDDPSNFGNPESLTELLRVPTLRSVDFSYFRFTPALFQALANAFMEGTAITKLNFIECFFSAGEWAAMMANALSRNTSVISIIAKCNNFRALFDALAAALPSNSTLRHLELGQQGSYHPDFLSPIFSALGQNTGLKSLIVHEFDMIDESLCTAMKDGLVMNATLERLELKGVLLSDNSDLWCRDSWCMAFSFLRTNKTLKSLMIDLHSEYLEYHVTTSCFSTLICDIVAMLQDNTSLESLSFLSYESSIKIKAEDYFVLVTALQHNRTLKTLSLHQFHSRRTRLTEDESKQMVSLLKKNYALESLDYLDLGDPVGDVSAILRLNKAGRRYLIEDGSSISKGVEVLSLVNDDIHCVFLHLLENPRLCDRSAVEKVSTGESNSSSTNPTDSSGEGKREQAIAHEGKESRRRLT